MVLTLRVYPGADFAFSREMVKYLIGVDKCEL